MKGREVAHCPCLLNASQPLMFHLLFPPEEPDLSSAPHFIISHKPTQQLVCSKYVSVSGKVILCVNEEVLPALCIHDLVLLPPTLKS